MLQLNISKKKKAEGIIMSAISAKGYPSIVSRCFQTAARNVVLFNTAITLCPDWTMAFLVVASMRHLMRTGECRGVKLASHGWNVGPFEGQVFNNSHHDHLDMKHTSLQQGHELMMLERERDHLDMIWLDIYICGLWFFASKPTGWDSPLLSASQVPTASAPMFWASTL